MVEGLSRDLLEANKTCAFRGIKIRGSLYLSHFLFVDDNLFFCDGLRRDALKLKEILDFYCIAIGRKIDIHKSTISFRD
jgi:hypothetical protein